MLVVALPAMARDAGTDIAAASWLITTYLIAIAAPQPIGGCIGDRFGRRRLMLGAPVADGYRDGTQLQTLAGRRGWDERLH